MLFSVTELNVFSKQPVKKRSSNKSHTSLRLLARNVYRVVVGSSGMNNPIVLVNLVLVQNFI